MPNTNDGTNIAVGGQAAQNNNVPNNSAENNIATGNQSDNNTTTTGTQNEKRFTQEEFNEALKNEVARKTKGLPNKDELKEFNDWKESKKSADQKQQEAVVEMQRLKDNNNVQAQMLEIMKKGISYDDAEFIQFKVSKMDGDFSDNLESYLKNNPKYAKGEDKKTNNTTGFSQNNAGQGVSEDKAYLDKKYANNPYYKK